MVEPDTTIPIGTYGAVSLPSVEADSWDIIIDRIDDSKYPEVKVYVSVIDPGNDSPMMGISKDNFEIEINENPLNKENIKNVEQFTGEVSKPASISLVIDRSGSMQGENYDDQPLEDAKTGAKKFVGLISSEDRAEVISFGDNATLDQSFTNDKQNLYNAINALNSDGATALYDAIWLGIEDTAKETNPCKAVIALTDGAENNSSSLHGGGNYDFNYGAWLEYPDNSLLIEKAQDAKIPVYTIGLQGFNFTRERVTRDYSTTENDLKEIAYSTGGEYSYAPKSAKLESIYKDIKQRMEQQYIITFTDDTKTAAGYLSVVLNYSQLYGYDTIEYNPSAQQYNNFNVHLTNVIPRDLLTLIDAYANSYYNSAWNLTLDQYKAWIATIAWAEGAKGGFTAHSHWAQGTDVFYHEFFLDDRFYFSTGIGPFQIDNGGDYEVKPWERWPTIDKLDPEKALKAVLKQHYNQFSAGSTLQVFSNRSRWVEDSFKWVGVWPSNVESAWLEITGSEWDDNNDEKNFILKWEEIKGWLANDDTTYSYESNVCPLGYRKWNIKTSDNIFTDANKPVIFDGDYTTWRIIARDEGGSEKFRYYYTYDPNAEIEVWAYADDSKHIFVREYSTGQYPEGYSKFYCGFTLSHNVLTL